MNFSLNTKKMKSFESCSCPNKHCAAFRQFEQDFPLVRASLQGKNKVFWLVKRQIYRILTFSDHGSKNLTNLTISDCSEKSDQVVPPVHLATKLKFSK